LIQKDHHVAGCQRLGGNGKSQGGIDLFAFDKLDPTRLVVFECKCWERFPALRLRETIDRFIAGPWVEKSPRYVLILAQQDLDELAKPWSTARSQLAEHGIEGELWTGTDLTMRVQRFPDVLSKFFPGAVPSHFANEWMQRVGFIERLHKALTHTRPEIRDLANDFLSHGTVQGEQLETRVLQDGHWHLKTPWLHINAILPGQRFYPGSASVVIRRENLGGITVVLSQRWLLSCFLGSIAAPIGSQYRPFIEQSVTESVSNEYAINLENCRFALEQAGVTELANAADELTKIYFDSLINLEKEWGAADFPFVWNNGLKVALCSVPTWLWEAIMEFMREHDVSKGSTDWHVFDGMSSIFKVYTSEPHPDFDPGYHCVLWPEENMEGLAYSDEVAVLWTPPFDDKEEKIGEKSWMSCEQTYEWLSDRLFPAVRQWVATESVQKQRRKKRWIEIFGRQHAELTDLRTATLLQNKYYLSLGLTKTVETLQAFFNNPTESERMFILQHDMKALYGSIIPVLRGKRGHPGYIGPNLGVKGDADTHERIIEVLGARIRQQEIPISSSAVDHTLRALLDALGRNGDAWLAATEKNVVFEALTPFMRFYDQQMLAQRHTRWLVSYHQ
jgi:hypothetical protein